MNNILYAFLFTMIAGCATGLGGLVVLFNKQLNKKFFSFMLGVSAGVMIYISFVEMYQESSDLFIKKLGGLKGSITNIVFFFLGILIIAIIDKLVPNDLNPHEVHDENSNLKRIGLFTAVMIFIHNIPEGMVTFMSTTYNIKMGLFMMIAILIHNIPEGIGIAVPLYYSTKSKKKAIFYSFLSGFAEPLGALLTYLILAPYIDSFILAAMFSSIAGIMIYISLDELLPTIEEYGKHHYGIGGIIIGMLVMAISLLFI